MLEEKEEGKGGGRRRRKRERGRETVRGRSREEEEGTQADDYKGASQLTRELELGSNDSNPSPQGPTGSKALRKNKSTGAGKFRAIQTTAAVESS